MFVCLDIMQFNIMSLTGHLHYFFSLITTPAAIPTPIAPAPTAVPATPAPRPANPYLRTPAPAVPTAPATAPTCTPAMRPSGGTTTPAARTTRTTTPAARTARTTTPAARATFTTTPADHCTAVGVTPSPAPRTSLPQDPSLAYMYDIERSVRNGHTLPLPPRQMDEVKIAPHCPSKMKASDVVVLVSRLGSPPDVSSHLKFIFGYSSSNKSFENQVISRGIHHYLHHHGRKDTEDVSANLRAILMTNSAQKDEDEFINNSTFTYPMEAGGMMEAAEAAILFYYNNPQVGGALKQMLCKTAEIASSTFPGDAESAGKMIAPSLIFGRIFYSLLTEKPTSTTDASILSQLAASLCFKEGSGDCRIYHADACSKRLAALHSALRAGCCTALKAELPNDAEFEEHAAICMKSVRSADPNSRLAQLVGHFRRLHQRTTFSRPPTTANGQISEICFSSKTHLQLHLSSPDQVF